MTFGIDVSRHQRSIDWQTVKNAGVEFVIIKAGGQSQKDGFYKDSKFEEFYNGAKAVGLPVGAYYWTSEDFYSTAVGVAEAEHFASLIAGKTFEYPVWADVESVPVARGKQGITAATIAFCQTMENKGYYCGIYASDISGFASRLNFSALSAFDKWVANYSRKPTYAKPYGMWQFGGSQNCLRDVHIDGVESNACDQSYAYKDYPAIIKGAGLNGFGKTEEKTESRTSLWTVRTAGMSKGDLATVTNLLKELKVSYTVEGV